MSSPDRDHLMTKRISVPYDKIGPILDYVLDHASGDERPYLRVSIFGTEFLGLLDSGATRTIVGRRGWDILQRLGISLNCADAIGCTVANGNRCFSIGSCRVPIAVQGKCFLLDVLVVPEFPKMLLLGADFWKTFGVVPDLRNDIWHFSEDETLDYLECNLNSEQKEALDNLVGEYFRGTRNDDVGCTNVLEHEIVVNSPPIKQRYYPVSPILQKHIDAELDDMLKKGIVERSNSPWASPILLVKKKDGSYRFCVDYRKLNSCTVRDSYPLPYVSNTLDKLRDARYISTLDIKSAFWQVPVKNESRQYTAFTVPNRGLFQFRRMPFGLCNSPATWQRLMDIVLGNDLEPYVFCYLDDIVIVTQDFEKHLEILEEVFRRLRNAKLTVSEEKCQFCREQLRYLGYLVDRKGLHVDPDKVRAMVELPTPKNVKDVRSVLGTVSWYRRFVPNFSDLAAPLTALLKKNRQFSWSPECDQAFNTLKEKLIQAPILNCPDYSLPFRVQTDASGYGIGAVLSQPCEGGGENVICYLSRSLTKQEQNYSTTERECLAVMWALEKLRPYIEGIQVEVITDHWSLVWLQNLKDLKGRLARWAVRMQQFDFVIKHRKGKDHVVPDMLSRMLPKVDLINGDDFGNISDPWYIKMLKIVSELPGKYPTWRSTGNVLYKLVDTSRCGLDPHIEAWKLVVPKNLRQEVLHDMHDSPTSGHLGVFKTYARLTERYYWPKCKSDVAKYVKKCQVCLTHKPDNLKPAGLMVERTAPSRPWEMISTDIIGPFPRSKRGYTSVLVVTDYLSKFCLGFPMRKASASTVCRLLEEHVFMVFGVPRIIISDNGPQFKNEYKKLLEKYQVKGKFNANFHAQANPTERTNRTLKFMLSAYVGEDHRSWDVNLPQIICALNSAKSETTKYSPYFVNFGRRMMISGSDYSITMDETEECAVGPEEVKSEQLRNVFKNIAERMKVASSRNAEYYNLRRRPAEFLLNQQVYRRNFVLSDASKYFTKKLAPKFIGPFIVSEKLSPWTYRLKDPRGMDRGTWHAKDLRDNPNSTD